TADLTSRNGHHYRRSVAGIAMAARDELLKRIIETPPQFQNWLSKWNSLLESVEGGVEGHDHR
ncbi:MAG: hypothetical protein N2B03_06925, partial [Boseongicola sp.]